jgi:pimeloyl-ACP methyl ester carboxylesterase
MDMTKMIFPAIFLTLMGVAIVAIPTTAMDLTSLKAKYSDRHFSEIQLPVGRTHYQSIGSGPVVLLIHGVSGPLAVWDKSIDALVSAGYRVVRYDLLGRGFSERQSNSPYDIETYIQQLEQFISALNLKDVRLVGSSFGAVVASEYSLRHPQHVKGLVLIGPAGFPITVPFMAKLGKLPLVGPLLTRALADRAILRQNDHYFVNGKMPDELRHFVADQLAFKGTTDAILKTMKNAPVQSYVESYEQLGQTRISVGVIWGRQDQTFPYENASILTAAIPHAKLVTVENAGHLPQYERAAEIIPALVGALKGKDYVRD